MKRTCGTWIAIYLLLAAAIGVITYRRFPVPGAALGAALIGGGVAWLGVAYLAGIWQKSRAAALIRRGLSGEPPRDGEKIAAIGRVSPTGGALRSPLSGSSCVAYKYEIRSHLSDDSIMYYEGFALTPSAIQTPRQAIRLLAWGDIKESWKSIPVSEAKANAEEYIARTQFRDPTILNFRQSLAAIKAIYQDDDGSVRWDIRGMRPPLDGDEPIDMDLAVYREILIRPGQSVCVIGRYSAQRGGIVPSEHPIADPVTIETGEAEAFTPRAAAGAVGYFIGGVIFLGVALIALAGFHAAVPLEAAEQMSPGMVASWPEIRLERILDKRVRPLMPTRMLSDGQVVIQLASGTANGRVRGKGRSEVVRRAEARRSDGQTTVTIDDGLVILAIDVNRRPLRVNILGENVPPEQAQIRIDEAENEIAGRITYLPDSDGDVACRVTFRARTLMGSP